MKDRETEKDLLGSLDPKQHGALLRLLSGEKIDQKDSKQEQQPPAYTEKAKSVETTSFQKIQDQLRSKGIAPAKILQIFDGEQTHWLEDLHDSEKKFIEEGLADLRAQVAQSKATKPKELNGLTF